MPATLSAAHRTPVARALTALRLLLLASTVTTIIGITDVGAQETTTTTTPTTTTTSVPTTTTTIPIPPGAAPLPIVPPSPTPLPLVGDILRIGSHGADVAGLQFTLALRGFWLSDRVGTFGESTQHALVAFQKYYGLRRTGTLDAYTRLAVGAFAERAAPRSAGTGRRIEVDLTRQVMIVSTGPRVDWVFDIASGARATPSPRGTYRLQRQILGVRRAALGTLFSPKYFTGGYAIHGSNSVPTQPASHGCIRVTRQTIDFLWASNLIPLGTPISLR